MSVDKLQEKIRKCKNPTVIDFDILPEQLPPHLLESEGAWPAACERFCRELMEGLRGLIPAVRFSFSHFALMGPEGLDVLSRITGAAGELGFYVFLDGPETLDARDSAFAASVLLGDSCTWHFDGLICVSYIGSDGLKPYIDGMKKNSKDLFAVVRTANRTAPELQDLLTGSRLVHLAKADIVNRYAEPFIGRSGYSRAAVMASASSADSVKALRTKYPRLFLLLDGYDYPNSNAKNCSFAFDKLGHGAIACAGSSVTAAWQESGSEGWQYVREAQEAAERMKRNLTRYITVL